MRSAERWEGWSFMNQQTGRTTEEEDGAVGFSFGWEKGWCCHMTKGLSRLLSPLLIHNICVHGLIFLPNKGLSFTSLTAKIFTMKEEDWGCFPLFGPLCAVNLVFLLLRAQSSVLRWLDEWRSHWVSVRTQKQTKRKYMKTAYLIKIDLRCKHIYKKE